MAKKNPAKSTSHNGRKLAILLLASIAVITGLIVFNLQSAAVADVVVYKSPTCGCCKEWISHLEDNGFRVEVHDQQNLNPIKTGMGVPDHLQSCHTAKVGGYVVEGHVPADVIARMLKEKPKIKGLAVPGMPMGSPGMEGPRKDPYDVMAFGEKDEDTVYESR